MDAKGSQGLPEFCVSAEVVPTAAESVPIRVTSIVVKRGRIVCEVEMTADRFRYTNPQVARWIQERYPNLSRHACVNARGRTFGCVIENTSVPHLLEHLAIELQTQSSKDPQVMFVGTTEWLDENGGLALVQLSFRDDFEALRALKEAVAVIADAFANV